MPTDKTIEELARELVETINSEELSAKLKEAEWSLQFANATFAGKMCMNSEKKKENKRKKLLRDLPAPPKEKDFVRLTPLMAKALIAVYDVSIPMEPDDMMDDTWLAGWNQAMVNVRKAIESTPEKE